MRIERLVLESFGACEDLKIDLAPGFNLFFGGNEQGKSTLVNGLLLALLGAPAQAEPRRRYQPLDGRRYAVSVHFSTAGGREFRIDRDLGPGGKDRVAMRDGKEWLTGRRPEAALKELGLPSLDLARATAVICGSEVVLASREGARTVSKALSARVAGDEGAATGQGALRRLQERRVRLENKERRALEEELKDLRRIAADLAAARETEERLSAAVKAARDELARAREIEANYRPAVEAMARLEGAKAAHDQSLARHAAIFADLRALRELDREIDLLERELAPLAGHAAALSPEAVQRFHQLLGMCRARQEAAAQAEVEKDRLSREIALLRARQELQVRAGFTPERFRELDRIDAAVGLAEQNLAEKRAVLAALEKRDSPLPPYLAPAILFLIALGGLAAALAIHPAGWAGCGAALVACGIWFFRRRRRAEELRAAQSAADQAGRELDRARAAFLLNSGGRDFSAWRQEFAAAQEIAENLRALEAKLSAADAGSGAGGGEAEELRALIAAGGADSPEDYERRARVWADGRRRLEAARAARASLLRERDESELIEQEAESARREAADAAVLAEAEALAAGLDPVVVARHRAELAALDLAELARRVDRTTAACEQHRKSAFQRDPWEVETALALTEQKLAEQALAAEAVRLAIEVMGRAVAEVQGSLVPKIEARASGLFARLTGGAYDGLHLESGAELIEVEPIRSGRRLPERILSSGTADQMYFALRLALAEELQGAEPLPLILDDPFITFDGSRLRLALELLAETARERQVILVTKDDTLCEIAEDLGYQRDKGGTSACGGNGLTLMRMASPAD